MSHALTTSVRAGAIILILALMLLLFFWQEPINILESAIGENYVKSAFIFVALMCIATLIAPVSTLPLVPALAPFFGPLATAIFSIIGWALGALGAFLIGRYAGRPILSRMVSTGRIESYERRLPRGVTFLWVVALRMVIPVDILSYALGFLSSIPLSHYMLATIIGITPFAFIFSYSGSFVASGNYFALAGLVAIGIVIFTGVYFLYKRHQRG